MLTFYVLKHKVNGAFDKHDLVCKETIIKLAVSKFCLFL